MQLTSIFTLTILALGVTAAPNPSGSELENRNSNGCKSGEIYNAHWKTCSCPPKQEFIKYKCRYPPMKEPWCGKDKWGNDEYKWCSKTKYHWTKYHKDHSYCEDNGQNSVFCSSHKEVNDKLKDMYPDNKPNCKDKQEYCGHKKSCQCPWGMDWKNDEQKCRYPVIPKPKCDSPKGPWCGKSKKKYCKHDDKKDECENDGSAYAFCSNDWDISSVADSMFDD